MGTSAPDQSAWNRESSGPLSIFAIALFVAFIGLVFA